MKSPDPILPSPIQELFDTSLEQAGIRVWVKRDDLIHPEISGNKWRKLKFNAAKAIRDGHSAIVSFGGAHSNHLYALASFGKLAGIRTVGFVRGDELNAESSPTLRHCTHQGMELHFMSREAYRNKDNDLSFKAFILTEPDALIVPEGGSNELALPGVGEIVEECNASGYYPDYFVVPAGSGGTAGGLLARGQNIVAVAVLKGAEFLRKDITKWSGENETNLDLRLDYHFGGYGKYNQELLEFIDRFEDKHQIPLEQVYTGKMFYGLFDLIKRGYFAKGTTLMAVHTGGLQGKLKS